MQSRARRLPATSPVAAAANSAASGEQPLLRFLIWAYLILLIFEGALRKWLLPGFSAPLLIVRDPVVLIIYAVAVSKNIFPWNRLVAVTCLLAIASVLASLLASGRLIITLYGFRTNFLHLPLIFLIPKVLNSRDLVKIGQFFLITAVPMTALVVWQFRAGESSWINSGAGSAIEGQLLASSSHIRPAGTFSFVTGMVSFLSMVAVFLYAQYLDRATVPRWYHYVLVPSLILSLVVSGSRSAILTVSIVMIGAVIVGLRQPQRFGGVLTFGLICYVVFLIAGSSPIFREGLAIQKERFRAGSGVRQGIVDRYFTDLTDSFNVAQKVPLLGEGLGVGTNAGSALLIGRRSFLLGESEWDRVVSESGPILGYIYILLRLTITSVLARFAWLQLRQGYTVAFLLFSAVASDMIAGQFGQPTTLGFTVLLAGLVLISAEDDRLAHLIVPREPRRGVRGRSRVAVAVVGTPPKTV